MIYITWIIYFIQILNYIFSEILLFSFLKAFFNWAYKSVINAKYVNNKIIIYIKKFKNVNKNTNITINITRNEIECEF